MKKLIWLVLPLALLALLAGSALAAGGTGTGDALLPIGQTQTVAPHSAQWYRFDYGGDGSQITASVTDNGASGIRLAIYTPQEITNWQQGDKLTAIGVGSQDPVHDLVWVGQFNFPGRFYAVVYNDSDASVPLSVNVTGDAVTTVVNVVPTATPLPNPFATVTPLGKGFSGRLAFVDSAGGALYTVHGDGSNLKRISFGMDPQWNHTGTQIALARQGPVPGIFTVNADGSNENMLYQTNEPRAPDWSPDDAKVIFTFMTTTKEGGQLCFTFRGRRFCFNQGPTTVWKLATVDSGGGGYLDVRTTNNAITPSWNVNGDTILFNDLSIGIMQGSISNAYDPFDIIGDLRVTEPDFSPLKLMSPQYSPDGKSVVYMVMQTPAWQIAVANADGTNEHLLTQLDPLDFVHPNNFAPIWSPDGKQILFMSDRNGKVEFFLMNADGTGQVQVLKNISDQIKLGYEFESERMMSWTK